MGELTVHSSVSELPGIGKVRAEAFFRMGVFTLEDLILHVPRAYEHRGNIRLLKNGLDDTVSSFRLTVGTEPKNARLHKSLTVTKFRAFDESGSVELVFFNQAFLKDVFHVGEEFRFWGKITRLRNGIQMTSPKYEKIREEIPLPDFVPVYPLSEGLTPRVVADAVDTALRAVLPSLKDPLPSKIRTDNKLPTLASALRGIHKPQSNAELVSAVRRLAFDEFFDFAICLATQRSAAKRMGAPGIENADITPLTSRLPYELTDAQKRVCREMIDDMSTGSGEAMNRILIGDVGCGKTVCAAIAMFTAVNNGYQAALMAPTEILARQHHRDLRNLLEPLGIRVELLLGSTSQKEKNRIYESLATEGEKQTNIVIGTHALLSEKVQFANLALTVTDEQHRFGVMQRAALQSKRESSHLLVMTATPIPRTLALTLYGDLAVSKIDEMPGGRQKVATFVVDESYRERMYGFVRKEVESGGQVYIVCPAIEEKKLEDGEISLEDLWRADSLPRLKCAADLYAELRTQVFPDLSVGFLHGKMKAAEKDAAMERFVSGQTQILVSTTVIEVGVNVPTASLMIVENAERFGLSQLHQLRGRVGRGTRKSYCILVSDAKNEVAQNRLQTMRTTYDGYRIAEADLKQRGPGDFFASSASFRQSGAQAFRFATLSDETLTATAFAEASNLIQKDPALSLPEHHLLKEKTERLIRRNSGTVS